MIPPVPTSGDGTSTSSLLVSCAVCRQALSRRALACPSCGHPTGVIGAAGMQSVHLPGPDDEMDLRCSLMAEIKPAIHPLMIVAGIIGVGLFLAFCSTTPASPRHLDWVAPTLESGTNSINGDGAEWRGRPSTTKEVCCRTMGNPWTGSECLFQNQHQVDVYHQCIGD